MVHKRSALAKEARQASHTASRQAQAVSAAGEDSYPCHPDPSAVFFALEPLRRSLLTLPVVLLRAAARRLREILAEIDLLISQYDAQVENNAE